MASTVSAIAGISCIITRACVYRLPSQGQAFMHRDGAQFVHHSADLWSWAVIKCDSAAREPSMLCTP